MIRAKEGVEDNYEEAHARSIGCARRRRTWSSACRPVDDAFRAGSDTRAAGSKIIFRLRPAHRAADLRRPYDRAGGGPGHRGLDPAQGRHRDQLVLNIPRPARWFAPARRTGI